jgi:glycosyltransferase involved in cell wall biosynthesis
MLDISEIAKRDAKTGIQRVVRSLLRELLEYPPQDVEVLPIYFDGIRYRAANNFVAALTGERPPDVTDEIVDFCQDDIYLALDLNTMTKEVHDVHMRLMCRGVQFYFIVYDILLLHRPDWWPAGYSGTFESWLRNISKVATGLVCISESVAQDVRTWLAGSLPSRVPDIRVASFHLGADIGSSLPTEGMPDNATAVLDSLGARASFLMVGTVEPRKGHAQVLAAFELLWHQGISANLVIVGKQGWMVDLLADKLRRHPELGEHLFWLKGISDEYLEKVYAVSGCLIAASEGEGFGLPLIEAVQHKLPIIARDIPVFREVAGEHAFYFCGLEPVDLANAISGWLGLNSKGLAPKSDEMPWLTWRESARQLIARIDSLTTIPTTKDKK